MRKGQKIKGRRKEKSSQMSTSDGLAAIFRKMNTINKAGRPIIPSQSGDESFSSGRAREKGWRPGAEAAVEREGNRRTGRNGTEHAAKKGTRGQFVIKFKIPSAEEPMKE